jgi:hypothetical protein
VFFCIVTYLLSLVVLGWDDGLEKGPSSVFLFFSTLAVDLLGAWFFLIVLFCQEWGWCFRDSSSFALPEQN